MAEQTKHPVSLNKVSFARDNRPIFDQISLAIPRGKITAILGPSGTGKTTLLYLLSGLIQADSGQVNVLGQRVDQMGQKQLYQLRKQMALLFQSGALFTDMSVFDNVAFPLRQNTKLTERFIQDIVLMKLEAVGLRGAASLMPAELSGGMNRRVALARSIALDPDLMLYDEPFTGQDPLSMGTLLQLIKTLNDALNLTSIIVTHDIHEVLTIADYILVIGNGTVMGQGSAEDIRTTKDPWVKQFINGDADGPMAFHYPANPIAQAFLEEQNHG